MTKPDAGAAHLNVPSTLPSDVADELQAIATIVAALAPRTQAERRRILDYVQDRFGADDVRVADD